MLNTNGGDGCGTGDAEESTVCAQMVERTVTFDWTNLIPAGLTQFHIHWHDMDGVEWPSSFLNDGQITRSTCGSANTATRWNRPWFEYINADDDWYPDGIDSNWYIKVQRCTTSSQSPVPKGKITGRAHGTLKIQGGTYTKLSSNDWQCLGDTCSAPTMKQISIWVTPGSETTKSGLLNRNLCNCGSVPSS